MRRDLTASALAIVVFTFALGLVYPLLVTGVSQVAFPGQADGSRIERHGRTVGSELIGQEFTRVASNEGQVQRNARGRPVLEPDPAYFQSRPSVTGYDPSVTFFNNLGPNNAELERLFSANLDAYLELEGPYNPGLDAEDVPADAVQTSASGIDPHISPTNAEIQAARVAEVRGATPERVHELIEAETEGPALGLLGEPGVNVLELNLALDEEMPTDA